MFLGGLSTDPTKGPLMGSKPAPWMEYMNTVFIKEAMNY